MKVFFLMAGLFLFQPSCFGQHIVFYLHGRIVEVKGADAVDSINGFGAYQYRAILDTLNAHKFKVISEVRPKTTEVRDYSQKLAKQILDLISAGTNPSHITVIGASKGALIAMLTSGLVKNPAVNYVFMAACSQDNLVSYPEINFYGNILSISEKSDQYHDCSNFTKGVQGVTHYKELELSTGLRHGFFYRPIPEWLVPAMAWANGDYR
ncbi:MAG: alpha/beta hydrolase [bacterium]|nr:alpha/beta hydrolase [bacterium]